MTDWVRFHKELRKGRKKELTRATRFVYLELSSEAREGRGVIQLRKDLPLVDAVLDAIGGGGPRDRKEVREAIGDLTDPDHAMIVVDEGSRTITLPSWSKWNHIDSSADRTRNYRARRTTDEGDETDRVTRHNVTQVTSRDIEACDSVTEPEERRSEERRGEEIARTSAPPPEASPSSSDEDAPSKRRRKPAKPLDPDFGPSPENQAYALANGLDVFHELAQFKAHAEATDRRQANWQAAFKLWLGRSSKYSRPAQSGIFASPAVLRPPPPAKPLEGSSLPPMGARDLFTRSPANGS